MTRRVVTALCLMLVLSAACDAEEDPTPAIEEPTAIDDGGAEGADDPVAGTHVEQGTITTLGDVRIGVYAVVSGTLAELSVDTPAETIENTELRVGDEVEVGGYTVTLTEAGSSFARVLLVDPDGLEVAR